MQRSVHEQNNTDAAASIDFDNAVKDWNQFILLCTAQYVMIQHIFPPDNAGLSTVWVRERITQ